MNKVLSLLLAFVFLQTQSWALSGGPNYGGGNTGATSLIGIYSGALLPSGEGESLDPNAPVDPAAVNGLGLFTLSVPETGLGTGDFVYFSEGRTFTGTITGVADPEKGTLTGLVKGQFDIIVDSIQVNDPLFGNASATQTQPGGFANGQIEADFVPGAFPGVTAQGIPFPGLRIEGTATVEISEFRESQTREPGVDTDNDPTTVPPDIIVTTTSVVTTSSIQLSVDGFQQSPTPGTTTIANLGGATP